MDRVESEDIEERFERDENLQIIQGILQTDEPQKGGDGRGGGGEVKLAAKNLEGDKGQICPSPEYAQNFCIILGPGSSECYIP